MSGADGKKQSFSSIVDPLKLSQSGCKKAVKLAILLKAPRTPENAPFPFTFGTFPFLKA